MRKFSRNTNQRKNLLRVALRTLVEKKELITTDTRAKELKKHFDKIINSSKKSQDLFSRSLFAFFQDFDTVKKIKLLSQKLDNRTSGYTSIIKIGNGKTLIKILLTDEKPQS